MSDWGGAHDTRECALNGLDLEMGTETNYDDFYLAQPYLNCCKTANCRWPASTTKSGAICA